MTQATATAELDRPTVEALVLAELRDFDSDWHLQPVPNVQDLRSGAIAWLATFAAEAFTKNAKTQLARFCEHHRNFADYSHKGWYRQAYLESAMFALTGKPSWLRTIISNIDHESSQLRSSLHGPLGLIAPRLALTEVDLLSRMTRNLEVAHFFNESMLCIFCSLEGEAEHKLSIAANWQRLARLAPQDVDALDRLCGSEHLSNSFLAAEYGQINRHLVCRLLDPRIRKAVVAQDDLFGSPEMPLRLNEVVSPVVV